MGKDQKVSPLTTLALKVLEEWFLGKNERKR
jgi:hypothetical protein